MAKKQEFVDLLFILKNVLSDNYIGENTLKVLYKKLEEDKELKEKFFEVLAILQMK